MRKRLPLYLLVLVVGLAVFLGLILETDTAMQIAREHTRWLFLALYALFFVSAGSLVWARAGELRARLAEGWKAATAAVVFVLACGAVTLVHEERNFKITADEYVLSLEAMTLHFEGGSQVPIRMHELGGVERSLGGTVNKRPPAFVSLLALVHDVTGYRVENVFYLNTVLVFVFYGLLLGVGRWMFGVKGGMFLCALWATFPLFYQNAAGAGFEILNLVFILLFLVAAKGYWDEPSAERQRFFVITSVLLANTRYESVLFAVAAGVVIVAQWWRRREVRCDASLYLAPLVMTTFLLRMRVFDNDRAGNWQVEAGQAPFSWEYVYDNIGHAMNHFLAFSRGSTSSELLWIPGLAGLVFMLYQGVKQLWKGEALERYVPLLAVSGVVLVNFGVLMFYHWGQLNYPEVTRLGLPLALIASFGATFLAFEMIGSRRFHAWAFVAVGAFGLLVAVPRGAVAESSHSNYHVRRADWLLEQVRALPEKQYVVASSDVGRLFLERIPGLPVGLLNERVKEAEYHLRLRSFELLVAQRFMVSPETGEESVVESDWLHPAFRVEPIVETTFHPFVVCRLSRVVSVDPALAEKPVKELKKEAKGKAPTSGRPGAEVQPVSAEVAIEWINKLP